MFNTNVGPKEAPLRDIRLQNLGDLEFDLSRSLKVKGDVAIGLPIYGFLLMFNSNIGPKLGFLERYLTNIASASGMDTSCGSIPANTSMQQDLMGCRSRNEMTQGAKRGLKRPLAPNQL